MIPIVEEKIFNKIALFYCIVTSVLSVSLVLVLIRTETYLFFGSRRIIPLFLLLILFETVKWSFHVIMYKKSNSSDLKTQTNFISLLTSVNYTDAPRCMLVLFTSCIVYYVIAVLFGAQVLHNKEETLMFSILLTTLTVLPISIQFGSESVGKFVLHLPPNNCFNTLVYRNGYSALLGAWLGAMVIPLDWDRAWQVWPISCSLGTFLGYTISNCLHLPLMIISLWPKTKEKII